MNRRLFSAVEMIKMAIIALLVMALLVNASGYITLIQNVATGGLDEIPWEKLRVFENGGIIPETGSVNAEHISPVYVGMRYGGKTVCSIYDKAMNDMLFKGFCPFLEKALGEGSQSSPASDELWNKCMDSPDFVYMKLAGELPAAALCVFLAGKDAAASDTDAFVSELFLLPSTSDSIFCVVLRDNEGNVTKISPSAQNERLFNNTAIKAYTDKASGISFSFLGERGINELDGIYSNNISKITLPGTFPVLDSFTYAPSVRFVSAVGFQSDSEEFKRSKRLLQVLGYNPEKARYYGVMSGSRTYVDNQGSLRIQSDGAVLFTGEEGLHLSRYLGYDSQSYSFSDIISCADILMDSLGAAIDTSSTESDGMSIKLCSVEVRENGVTVNFAFYSDGYRLLWDGVSSEVMACVTIKNNAVMGVSLRAGTVEKGVNTRNLSPIYPLKQLEKTGGAKLISLELCYKIGNTDSYILPVWIAKAKNGAEEVDPVDTEVQH